MGKLEANRKQSGSKTGGNMDVTWRKIGYLPGIAPKRAEGVFGIQALYSSKRFGSNYEFFLCMADLYLTNKTAHECNSCRRFNRSLQGVADNL